MMLTERELSRFLRYVSVSENGCWLWTGGKSGVGYGHFHTGTTAKNYKDVYAHRLSYILWNGPIAKGLVIDHLCRSRACVNPDHLEAVTTRTNLLRGEGRTALFARRTHCRYGHPLSGPNLYLLLSRKTPQRRCRTCYNARKWKTKPSWLTHSGVQAAKQ